MKFRSRANQCVVLIFTLFLSAHFTAAQDGPLQGLDDYVKKALACPSRWA